jgi:transposase
VVVALLWPVAMLNYLDRQMVSTIPTSIRADGRRATQLLAMVAELYAVEDAAKEKIQLLLKQTHDAPRAAQEQIRHALRQDKSKPILAKIKIWLETESQLVLPRSPMAQAINYTLNQWEALNRYTEQGYLHIDNMMASYCTSFAA